MARKTAGVSSPVVGVAFAEELVGFAEGLLGFAEAPLGFAEGSFGSIEGSLGSAEGSFGSSSFEDSAAISKRVETLKLSSKSAVIECQPGERVSRNAGFGSMMTLPGDAA